MQFLSYLPSKLIFPLKIQAASCQLAGCSDICLALYNVPNCACWHTELAHVIVHTCKRACAPEVAKVMRQVGPECLGRLDSCRARPGQVATFEHMEGGGARATTQTKECRRTALKTLPPPIKASPSKHLKTSKGWL